MNVDAVVAATLRQNQFAPESTIVFLDRGQDDGLAVGNRLPVMRHGDGSVALLSLRPKGDERFPREVFGELLVVDVRGKTATAVVSHSMKEISVGDAVQARKGY